MSEVITNFEDLVSGMPAEDQEAMAERAKSNQGERPPSIRARSRDLFEMEVRDEPTKNLFNDDNPVFLHGIIVAYSVKQNEKDYFGRKFYEREHDPNMKAGPPHCFSSNSIKPHPDIKEPYSRDGCKVCPMAKGPNRRARCTYEARIAFALVPWQNEPTFEGPYSGYGYENSIFQLTVPHASIFATDSKNEVGLNPYINNLRKFGFLPRQIVTRIGFFQYPTGSKGPKKLIYPKLHFSAVGTVAEHATKPCVKNGGKWVKALDEYFVDGKGDLADETLKRFVTVSYPIADVSETSEIPDSKAPEVVNATSHIALQTRTKPEAPKEEAKPKAKPKKKSGGTDILESLIAEGDESDDGE